MFHAESGIKIPDCEKCAEGSGGHNRSESLKVIDSFNLCETHSDKAGFVLQQLAFRVAKTNFVRKMGVPQGTSVRGTSIQVLFL